MYVCDISSWCHNSNKVHLSVDTVCHYYCHCLSPLLQQVEQLSSWRAHVAEVVSIEYIPYDDSALVLTASADCTARLWTITGNYIGTFGQVREGGVIRLHTSLVIVTQEQHWNIKDPLTYQHPQ